MATTLEMKIRELLREARLKENEHTISKIKETLATISHHRSYKLPAPPASLFASSPDYKVTLKEQGRPPILPIKYDDRLKTPALKEKLLKKFDGRSRAKITITGEDFSCWFTVLVTYKSRFDYDHLLFSDIETKVTTGMTTVAGTQSIPLEEIVREAVRIYVRCTHSAKFTQMEYDIEKKILDGFFIQPTNAKRARME